MKLSVIAIFLSMVFASPVVQASDIDILAKNIYFEANAEPYAGKVAIAFITLNRVKSPHFPDTIEKVVYQNNKPGTRFCQFSWTCDGKKDIIPCKETFDSLKEIASKAIDGKLKDPIGGADHFHNDSVIPSWAKRLKKTKRIGGHTFYKRK